MAKDSSTDPKDFKMPSGWRGEVLAKVRELFAEADPEIVEEVKYKTPSNPNGVLVWYKDGMLCTGEVYKEHLRIAFTKGPDLKEFDTDKLINSYRAILLREGDKLKESAFKDLVRAAVRLNQK